MFQENLLKSREKGGMYWAVKEGGKTKVPQQLPSPKSGEKEKAVTVEQRRGRELIEAIVDMRKEKRERSAGGRISPDLKVARL